MGGMVSIDIERRLAALEAENHALRSKIVELEERGGRKIIPAPREPEARIFHPVEVVKADSPDDKKLRALRAICAREYPDF